MSDWILKRNYRKYTKDGNFGKGGVSDSVHISKNFGIKYLRPLVDAQENVVAEKPDETTNVTDALKKELKSPARLEVEADNCSEKHPNFECIYVTISSQPL